MELAFPALRMPASAFSGGGVSDRRPDRRERFIWRWQDICDFSLLPKRFLSFFANRKPVSFPQLRFYLVAKKVYAPLR